MKVWYRICILLTVAGKLQAQDHSERLVQEAAARIEQKTIKWRRDFHQHPELGNNEKRTAGIIAAHLRALGLDVKEGIAKTGVVALLKGGMPGPCIGLRADMDALPVVERTALPFASTAKSIYNGQEVGVMHACGHDTHMAILMSVAEILSGMKNRLRGTVKFIFQPAEEGPPEGEEGGAPLMIKEGVMMDPKVDVMFGLHIKSNIEAGQIRYKAGAFMASSDWFTINVKGKSSHGSEPWLGVDPILVSAQIIEGLQTVVSRQSELTKGPVVVSVGKIHSGVRSNIIPEVATLEGTIRTLDKTMQKRVHAKIREMVPQIAKAAGASAEVSITNKTLVTYNDPALLKKVLPALIAAAGEKNVAEMNWTTGAEDFSFFNEKAPCLFFYLGGMKKGLDPAQAYPHHTPDFVVEESAMKLGVMAFCQLVISYNP